MEKEKVYNEICGLLADNDRVLQDFKKFHDRYKDSESYSMLFDSEYGAMYESLKAAKEDTPKSNTTKKEDKTVAPPEDITVISNYMQFLWKEGVHNDIRIIRKWVQFFGWLTIISLICYTIHALYLLAALD